MDNGKQIEQYLEELAHELIVLQVAIPFHILITGGAYMLIAKQRKSTLDVDFTLLDMPEGSMPPDRVFPVTLKKNVIASRKSTVPYAAEFKRAVSVVAARHLNLDSDFINDEAAAYLYDDAPHAEISFWRAFGNTLSIYLPTTEYMFATKLMASRPKDIEDIQLLMSVLKIRTWEQAKAIIDKFILPDGQSFWEVDEKLENLFP
ncbi:MAG: hypothetical protein ACRDHW_11530 [Ktedonobacteraceae bacterium]